MFFAKRLLPKTLTSTASFGVRSSQLTGIARMSSFKSEPLAILQKPGIKDVFFDPMHSQQYQAQISSMLLGAAQDSEQEISDDLMRPYSDSRSNVLYAVVSADDDTPEDSLHDLDDLAKLGVLTTPKKVLNTVLVLSSKIYLDIKSQLVKQNAPNVLCVVREKGEMPAQIDETSTISVNSPLVIFCGDSQLDKAFKQVMEVFSEGSKGEATKLEIVEAILKLHEPSVLDDEDITEEMSVSNGLRP